MVAQISLQIWGVCNTPLHGTPLIWFTDGYSSLKLMRIAQGQQFIAQGQPRWVAPTAAGAELEFDFPTLGIVENGVMLLNDSGKMVQQI
jgi:hypothetical protein